MPSLRLVDANSVPGGRRSSPGAEVHRARDVRQRELQGAREGLPHLAHGLIGVSGPDLKGVAGSAHPGHRLVEQPGVKHRVLGQNAGTQPSRVCSIDVSSPHAVTRKWT